MIPQLAFLRFVKLTRHTLQRFLGSLKWLSGPSSLNSVNLATAYSLLQKRSLPKTLPLSITYSLISAIIITLLPIYPRPLPPPLTMPTIFTDAAPSPQRSCYRVASVRYQSYATSVYAPNWVTDQQSAELYAIFHGLRQVCLRKLTYVCLVTDNSSAYFTFNFRKNICQK